VKGKVVCSEKGQLYRHGLPQHCHRSPWSVEMKQKTASRNFEPVLFVEALLMVLMGKPASPPQLRREGCILWSNCQVETFSSYWANTSGLRL
jgi:hypothetical protein